MKNKNDNAIIIPVIHMIDIDQVRFNIKTCIDVGINQVFIINHQVTADELIKCAVEMRQEYPELWIGINPLGVHPFTALSWNIPEIDAIWLDETLIETPPRKFKGIVFSGLAFKYQPQPKDIKMACEIAKWATDVACTSGPGTGKSPSVEKILLIREYLGKHPLAIASGVSSENIHLYNKYVDYLLVATSITDKYEIIEKNKLVELINANK